MKTQLIIFFLLFAVCFKSVAQFTHDSNHRLWLTSIDDSLGIGTASPGPGQKLEVLQKEAVTTDILYPIAINRNWNGHLGTSTPRNTGLLFKDQNSIQAAVSAVRENSIGDFKSGMAFLLNKSSSSSLVPTTALNEVMRITSAGWVGIGTSTPSAFLEILGTSAGVGVRSLSSAALGSFSGGGVMAETPNIPTAAAQRLGTMCMGGLFDPASPGSYRVTGAFNAYAAEPWSTTANGTYVTFNTTGLGTTSYAERMRIDEAGKVGIGTTSPSQMLEVYQNEANPTDVLYPIVINRNWSGGTTTTRNTGILFKDVNSIEAGVQTIRENSFLNHSSGISFLVNKNSTSMDPTTALSEVMRINSSGWVGIGTTKPDQILTVNGTTHSKAVIVDVNILPDYVFNKTYQLPSLDNVEEYITKNHHLQDVPSAAQVEKNGLNLGDMNEVLLKKVEELTLYMIDLKKQNNDLKKELIRTKKRNHLK